MNIMINMFPKDIWFIILTKSCDFEEAKRLSSTCKKLRKIFIDHQKILRARFIESCNSFDKNVKTFALVADYKLLYKIYSIFAWLVKCCNYNIKPQHLIRIYLSEFVHQKIETKDQAIDYLKYSGVLPYYASEKRSNLSELIFFNLTGAVKSEIERLKRLDKIYCSCKGYA